jgi:hypothetical protein
MLPDELMLARNSAGVLHSVLGWGFANQKMHIMGCVKHADL